MTTKKHKTISKDKINIDTINVEQRMFRFVNYMI
jgi:hypothetical protein